MAEAVIIVILHHFGSFTSICSGGLTTSRFLRDRMIFPYKQAINILISSQSNAGERLHVPGDRGDNASAASQCENFGYGGLDLNVRPLVMSQNQ